MKSLAHELLKELYSFETKTTKPRLFQFPELRDLMQKCEKEGLDHEKATIKICEYYEQHYGSIDIDTDPALFHGMMMV